MNDTSTCCQDGVCESDTAVATRHEAVFVEPAWNANRHDQGVELEVTLPGVRKDDLTVEVHGRNLQLDARRPASENRGRLIHGRPAPDGYRLKLRLADSLDGSKLKAGLADGVLKVSIPLHEAAQPRRVDIL